MLPRFSVPVMPGPLMPTDNSPKSHDVVISAPSDQMSVAPPSAGTGSCTVNDPVDEVLA